MKEKTNVIWGTGNVCSLIMNSELSNGIDFMIDNDEEKTGREMCGKMIHHASHISDWKNLYIIIAIDNYTAVKEQLINYGLKESQDFIWYRDWIFPQKLDELISHAEIFIDKIINQRQYIGYTMIFSDFLAFDKGVCNYVNLWSRKESKILLFSEAGWVSKGVKETLNIPVIKLPEILTRNQYLKVNSEQIINNETIVNYVREKGYMKEAAINLRMGYPDMTSNYEYVICYYADRIVRNIIEYWKPAQIVLWNAFYAFHIIIKSICNELKVPVRYMEFGNIPGTIIVESIGQMGESWPARFPQEFMEIPILKKEYHEGQRLISFLYESRLNRNVQPHNNLLENVRKEIKENRPIIFYAGQNDNASGLQPYTENSQKYHSPEFTCSDNAANYLAELCKKNDWNFIYKPHPMMVRLCKREYYTENTILVDNVDINELIDMSDLVVTILSTGSYIALIRRKPVVMLGYTQLKNKECTYEAFRKSDIEDQIRKAIECGFTERMKDNFVKHIVQMEKFYSDKTNVDMKNDVKY